MGICLVPAPVLLREARRRRSLHLGVKWGITAVAEGLPPRDSPFAALRSNRRLHFA